MGVLDFDVFLFHVKLPKMQPKFETPFLGFTSAAKVWNSRACMIGLVGIFIVELVSFSFSLIPTYDI